jgi:hypothetical protein
MTIKTFAYGLLALGSAFGLATLAQAEMVLSQVIVDLLPGNPPREDIEVWNDGPERMYVLAEPFEIRAAGTSDEQRVRAGPADQSGILVSPQRLVLARGPRPIVSFAWRSDRLPVPYRPTKAHSRCSSATTRWS